MSVHPRLGPRLQTLYGNFSPRRWSTSCESTSLTRTRATSAYPCAHAYTRVGIHVCMLLCPLVLPLPERKETSRSLSRTEVSFTRISGLLCVGGERETVVRFVICTWEEQRKPYTSLRADGGCRVPGRSFFRYGASILSVQRASSFSSRNAILRCRWSRLLAV